VCRETNEQTHFVSKTEEVNPAWFAPGQSVGICGATSTPMWLMEQVRDALERL
jgi:4-hydroxy-3-methylbut-2-enyl diphosphate reductase